MKITACYFYSHVKIILFSIHNKWQSPVFSWIKCAALNISAYAVPFSPNNSDNQQVY